MVRHYLPANDPCNSTGCINRRLLLIAPYYFPANYGGAPQVYHQLFSRLKGWQVTIMTQAGKADPDRAAEFDRNAAEEYGYRVVRLPSLQPKLDMQQYFLRRVLELLLGFRRIAGQ